MNQCLEFGLMGVRCMYCFASNRGRDQVCQYFQHVPENGRKERVGMERKKRGRILQCDSDVHL